VWADTILSAERQYVARTLAWAGLSIIAATGIAVVLAAHRTKSPVLAHFAVQLGGWGLVLGLIGAMEWQGLHLRDFAGAEASQGWARGPVSRCRAPPFCSSTSNWFLPSRDDRR
jgi:hypothetical protein